MESLRKEAFVLGGHGRHLQNKMSKTEKRKMDRRVDKRRRQGHKLELFVNEK